MHFSITHQDTETSARIGVLKTKSGEVETPFFMPVATRGVVKGLTAEDLAEIGVNVVISNALILYLRNGSEIVKKFGGIRKFMNFKGINFTDSGGFQMYTPRIYLKSNDKGVYFKNPISGEKLFITPEKDMEIQLDINADVAMCLDTMPMYDHSKEEISEAVRKTSLWAERCKKHHDELQKNISEVKKQLLFGIIQGGIYEDLRKKSAEDLIRLNFDGYSIGGFGLGETLEEELNIVNFLKKIIPETKPVYLMGIGSPVEILKAIACGVDIFDSRMPTQNARRGMLFTSKGKLRVVRKEFEFSEERIDENCDCFVCKNYSRAFIRYQLLHDEVVGKKLATYHNIYFLTKLIEKAKDKIRSGEFESFVKEVEEIYQE
ncbi:tRNA guanosine(34) transglycosylase Tgt [Candidatus Pacearchaeota archaeon]|nr:tRNA guanosine(34) transglycosylase Tgt [Candidatus Pacearchaeota archaeon]